MLDVQPTNLYFDHLLQFPPSKCVKKLQTLAKNNIKSTT